MDAVVCDPPYGLKFMGKKWDYDVPSVETWRAILDAMKPGAFLLAFGGSRTYHRMAVNVEDAGFEIRDQIMWIYGSGFPKSLDIGKAIDKAAGSEREVVGHRRGRGNGGLSILARPGGNDSVDAKGCSAYGPGAESVTIEIDITAPATDAAREWEGWGTALKPAHEPIILARKPLEGTVAANVLKHGVGGLNIDASRVETEDKYSYPNGPGGKSYQYSSDKRGPEVRPNPTESHPKGRWPANVIHDGSDEVEAGFPVAKKSNAIGSMTKSNNRELYGSFEGGKWANGHGDSGSASRFFYCAKTSKSERNAGLEDMPHRTAGDVTGVRKEGSDGLNSPRTGAGRTSGSKNFHPTVKPIALMEYLVRLVTPPGGTVLDPFMGSGSTGVAAARLGFDFVGVEMNEEYIEIARARINNVRNLFS